MLNKQKGNMYPWVTHTWNPIRGKCPHDCSYCYMKRFKVGELRLDEKSLLKDNLGKENTIFVGSSTDMFANEVPPEWIYRVLSMCKIFPENTYLFQSKNPEKFKRFIEQFPPKTILGTTIETNRDANISKAPEPYLRYVHINTVGNFKKMVSIEPIMDFDLGEFLLMMKVISPEFVSIGADSQGHNLPEPNKEKIEQLIEELKKFTEVKIKDNLKRLIK